MRVNPTLAKYIIGLDLGQVQDYSAFAIMEREWVIDYPKQTDYILEELEPSRAFLEYRLLDLQRYQLGTPYPDIVDNMVALMEDRRIFDYGGMLIVDVGHVGRAVLDILKKAGVPVLGVNITAGFAETASATDPWVTNVPKRELVTPLVLAYQTGRIRVGPSVPQSFDEELKAFGYHTNKRTGSVTYESLEAKVHDDQVVAAALAYWWAEKRAPMQNPLGNRVRAEIGKEYDPKGKA